MARMLSSNNPDLYKPGLRKAYLSAVDSIPREGRQLFNIISGANPGGQAGRQYFTDVFMASFGGWAPKPEGTAVQYDRIQEAGLATYTPFTWASGARITWEAREDELYGVMAKIARELGAAGAWTQEIQMFRPLNLGTGTAGGTGFSAVGFDNVALFSTAHPLKRGGTQANRATTDMDLSVTALEIAMDILETTVSESGSPDPRTAEVLVHAPQLYWTAKELTQSELKPYTANNEINPVYGEGLSGMMVHYLTDPDAWALLARKERHDINVWIRHEIDVDFGDDFDTGDIKMRGLFRIAMGHTDYRGTFWSNGA